MFCHYFRSDFQFIDNDVSIALCYVFVLWLSATNAKNKKSTSHVCWLLPVVQYQSATILLVNSETPSYRATGIFSGISVVCTVFDWRGNKIVQPSTAKHRRPGVCSRSLQPHSPLLFQLRFRLKELREREKHESRAYPLQFIVINSGTGWLFDCMFFILDFSSLLLLWSKWLCH